MWDNCGKKCGMFVLNEPDGVPQIICFGVVAVKSAVFCTERTRRSAARCLFRSDCGELCGMFVLNEPDGVPQIICLGVVAVKSAVCLYRTSPTECRDWSFAVDYGGYVKIVTVMFFSGISEILSIKKLSTAR